MTTDWTWDGDPAKTCSVLGACECKHQWLPISGSGYYCMKFDKAITEYTKCGWLLRLPECLAEDGSERE